MEVLETKLKGAYIIKPDDQRQYELPLGDTQHGTPTIPRGLITGAV